MGVDSIPLVDESGWLSDYKALIQRGDHESEAGQFIKQKLVDHFGANHQVMLECDRVIRLVKMKARLSSRKQVE